jgi:DNA (cytosine-5)-methyltransferase 1
LLHKTNHPDTIHLQDNVWNINPKEICGSNTVGLAWFSPDCKHFSKAKGSALVDKNIRGLAWIVLKWAGTVRPRVIMLENVEEFKTWGPVRKGKPVKSKSGQTFDKWLKQLKALGYDVDSRELVAADYGAPTTRKRFVLIARCDGKPIVWPERTHAPTDSDEVKSGKCKPWISAAEIIDWSLPCPSIFDTAKKIKEKYGLRAMRPLKENTMRRIARGIDKFVIKNQKPFIVQVNHGGSDRVSDAEQPLGTVTAKHGYGISEPVLTPYTLNHKFNNEPESIAKPLSTITSVNGHEIVQPILVQYHSEQSDKEVRASGFEKPLMTVDGSGRYGIAAAHLTQYFKGDHYHSPEEPLHTVTTEVREGVTLAHLTEFKGQDIGQNVDIPLRTVMTKDVMGAVYTRLEKIEGCPDLKNWNQVRTMLNTYCGYNIAEDEILLFTIGGIDYYISDIGLRMLTPKELYAAQGFPADYIIEYDYTGKAYPKTQQVAKCGNSVCPPLAKALVEANLPEYCRKAA